MADTKISLMTVASSLAGTELIPIVQGGTNKSATPTLLSTYLGGSFWALSGTSTLTGNPLIAQAGFNTNFSGIGTITFSPTSTRAGLNTGSYAGVPGTFNNGDLNYNSLTGTLQTKIGGNLSSIYASARVYNVMDYGAKHDYKSVTGDGHITSGAAILTSASANFTNADIGKYVWISGAGAAGVGLRTTILSYQSATQVTLSVNASTTVTTATIKWATDDTASIQSAFNACINGGGGTVYFPAGIYIVSGALQTSVGTASKNPNSQLYILDGDLQSSLNTTIRIIGEASYPEFFTPACLNGTIIQSTIDGSGTNPSILGGIGGANANSNYTNVIIEDIKFKAYTNNGATAPSISCVNMQWAATIGIKRCYLEIDTQINAAVDPTGTSTFGLLGTRQGNNGPNYVEQCWASGFEYGFIYGEHMNVTNNYALTNRYGHVFLPSQWTVKGNLYFAECKTAGIYFPSGTFLGIAAGYTTSYVDLYVESEALAGGPSWATSPVGAFYSDPSNYGNGCIKYLIQSPANAPTYSATSNLQFMSSNMTFPQRYSTAGDLITSSIATGVAFGGSSSILEIADRTADSGATTHFANLVLSGNKTGTGAANTVAYMQVLNTAIGGNEKRVWAMNIYTNGATNTSNYGESLNNAGTITTTRTVTPTLITHNIPTALTGQLNVSTKAYIGNISTAPTALLHLAAGTATASSSPLKFTSGTNLTTAETGAVEYNGTNLFFTRTGTTRENVLTGNDAASAPATNTIGTIVDYYGSSSTRVLTTPNSWASIVINGTTYKIPLYT